MLGDLTPRQWELVHLKCADDLTSKQIALVRFVSYQTVKNHFHDILTRTGYQSMFGVCTAYGAYLARRQDRPLIHAARADEV